MVMFHSYVSLPEGNVLGFHSRQMKVMLSYRKNCELRWALRIFPLPRFLKGLEDATQGPPSSKLAYYTSNIILPYRYNHI